MFYRFRYEAEFYPTLSRLPLDVRRKLDATGLQVSLNDWQAFSLEERGVLCHLPVDLIDEKQVFVAYVDFLSRHYQGKPAKTTEPMDASLWSSAQVPEPVAQKSASVSDPIGVDEWRTWQEHQRYALYKSALSKNQPEAFIAVLDELRASLGRRAQADD